MFGTCVFGTCLFGTCLSETCLFGTCLFGTCLFGTGVFGGAFVFRACDVVRIEDEKQLLWMLHRLLAYQNVREDSSALVFDVEV